MSEPISFDEVRPVGRAREALLRRLMDFVALPSSRVAPQDRSMCGDILLDMLFHATDSERVICAERLAGMREAPRRVLRYLAQSGYEIARPVLEQNDAFNTSDLLDMLDKVTIKHRLLIAERKRVQSAVCDRLIEMGEKPVIIALLENEGAALSEHAVDLAVALSRKHSALCDYLINRAELNPAQAMAMFWWSDSATRRAILQRYSADRREMIDMCADVFRLAADENWQDPVARKTLQLIERRQRNRAALEKSPFESLEQAALYAAKKGMSPPVMDEIGYLSGVKPVTIAKIFSDVGGEGLAVMCKATGMKRDSLRNLWLGLRRPYQQADGTLNPAYAHVEETFDILSVAKAQTTLRYWNWSLSSTYSPVRMNGTMSAEDVANDESAFSTPRRTARLVFGK